MPFVDRTIMYSYPLHPKGARSATIEINGQRMTLDPELTGPDRAILDRLETGHLASWHDSGAIEPATGVHFPTLPRLIRVGSSWSYHSGYGWTLAVVPTGWARSLAGAYLVGVADNWDELYSKYKNKGLNTNLNGMRDQLICHQQYVAIWSPTKSSWNLDEWRPNVGYVQTANARCNPAGSVIWD